MENTRFCSPNFRWVWQPTRLYSVPFALSRRSCRTAYGSLPIFGSGRPMGLRMPKRSVSKPRRALTSMGIQPSNTLESSKPCTGASSAVVSAFQNASYSSRENGQLI